MGIQVEKLVNGKNCQDKAFIDFEFDGKHISDFGMVAVFDGDRHKFFAAPEFSDETSEVNGAIGQYFWGTKINKLEKEFSLATDGMTEQQINAFKYHFRPGRYGKFIQCESPNRFSYARIADQIEFEMLPFRKRVTIGSGPNAQYIYINEYKGEAKIKFVFDDPYSYAEDTCFDVSNIENAAIAYADGIPFVDSWNYSGFGDCICGDTILEEKIQSPQEQNPATTSLVNSINYYNSSSVPCGGIINIEMGISLAQKTNGGFKYIDNFLDDVNNPNNPYNTIKISQIVPNGNGAGRLEFLKNQTSECRYSSPNFIYQINKAIKLAEDFQGTSRLEFEDLLRTEITHNKVIEMAITSIPASDDESSMDILPDGWGSDFNTTLLAKIPENSIFQLSLDSMLCKATFSCYTVDTNGTNNFLIKEENCGDIMRTEYLRLDGGDTLTLDTFSIYSFHRLELFQNDSAMNVNSISLEYKYMYI